MNPSTRVLAMLPPEETVLDKTEPVEVSVDKTEKVEMRTIQQVRKRSSLSPDDRLKSLMKEKDIKSD